MRPRPAGSDATPTSVDAMKVLPAVPYVVALIVTRSHFGGSWRSGKRSGYVAAWLAMSFGIACGSVLRTNDAIGSDRVDRGLEALYLFEAATGGRVKDHSGKTPPLDLHIDRLSSIKREAGFITIGDSSSLAPSRTARRLVDAIQRTGALSIEAWLRPAKSQQRGPARIVSLSNGPTERNFTLGQDGDHYDLRLRTSSTNSNGLPSTRSGKGAVKRRLTHLVVTRNSEGVVCFYVDGRLEQQGKAAGQLSPWQPEYRLAFANETTGDRPWLGELHLAAIYSAPLTAAEVAQNYSAGPANGKAGDHGEPEETVANPLFATKIAPLLARRCLECHDSAAREGGLDLSKKNAALAGGDSGTALGAGRAAESLLWRRVELNEMPPDESLSNDEKQWLHAWIDAGADWSFDEIDPALYVGAPKPPATWVRRLTAPEYIATIRATVDVDIEAEAQDSLPPDLRADGFSNTAYNLTVDLEHIEAYSHLAATVARRLDVAAFAAQFSKKRSISDDKATRNLIAKMGKWLLRGTLDEREITVYAGVATTTAAAGGDFEDAVRAIVEAMLQSPRFIYRIEDQRGDGTAWPLNDYELASRISYIVWGAPPDKKLYRAAESGVLQDREQLRNQVVRMLKDPRARARSAQFVIEWLDLNRLDSLRPNPTRFPEWDPQLAQDMQSETLAFFEELAWEQQRPLSDLFNAQFTFATPRLASHYGLAPHGAGWSRYDLSSVDPRGGLLTQGSLLTIGGDDASMVTRGLFVLHELLRGVVHEPPPGLDTTPVPAEPGLSRREIARRRVAHESCGGCHRRFEPLAYGLERFDGLGRYDEQDEFGNQLRLDGEVLFPGAAAPAPYQNTAELMNLLANSERVRQTITWKVVQFALGRPLTAAEAPLVDKVHEAAQQRGGAYAAVITELAVSDLVMRIQTFSDDPPNQKSFDVRETHPPPD